MFPTFFTFEFAKSSIDNRTRIASHLIDLSRVPKRPFTRLKIPFATALKLLKHLHITAALHSENPEC